MRPYLVPIAGLCLAFAIHNQVDSELAQPFQVMAYGEPIDVDGGNAAPCFTDWDGDDLNDLLVGQFVECKLRIYRNIGVAADPGFGDFEYFPGTVPGG